MLLSFRSRALHGMAVDAEGGPPPAGEDDGAGELYWRSRANAKDAELRLLRALVGASSRVRFEAKSPSSEARPSEDASTSPRPPPPPIPPPPPSVANAPLSSPLVASPLATARRAMEEEDAATSLRNGVHHANAVVWGPVTTKAIAPARAVEHLQTELLRREAQARRTAAALARAKEDGETRDARVAALCERWERAAAETRAAHEDEVGALRMENDELKLRVDEADARAATAEAELSRATAARDTALAELALERRLAEADAERERRRRREAPVTPPRLVFTPPPPPPGPRFGGTAGDAKTPPPVPREAQLAAVLGGGREPLFIPAVDEE